MAKKKTSKPAQGTVFTQADATEDARGAGFSAGEAALAAWILAYAGVVEADADDEAGG